MIKSLVYKKTIDHSCYCTFLSIQKLNQMERILAVFDLRGCSKGPSSKCLSWGGRGEDQWRTHKLQSTKQGDGSILSRTSFSSKKVRVRSPPLLPRPPSARSLAEEEECWFFYKDKPENPRESFCSRKKTNVRLNLYDVTSALKIEPRPKRWKQVLSPLRHSYSPRR